MLIKSSFSLGVSSKRTGGSQPTADALSPPSLAERTATFRDERLKTDRRVPTTTYRSRAPTASSVEGLKVHQIAPARRRIIAATEGSFLWC
jgi:hypothetical protein